MRLPRRAVLAGGLLLPVSVSVMACTGGDGAPVRPAPVDPDVALREAAVSRERALLAAYDAALQQDPGRADRLAPVRAEHAAHLVALGAPEPPSTGSTTPSVPTSVPPSAAAVPLAQAERDAAAAHAAATVEASPELAAVLAQLAASEASHPVALA